MPIGAKKLAAIAAVMSASAALCSLVIAVLVYRGDVRREGVETHRATLQEFRTHRRRTSELDTVFVCIRTLLKLPEGLGKSIWRLRTTGKGFYCTETWCWQYRRCTGLKKADAPDGSWVRVGEEEAWTIGRTVRDGIESFETIAYLGCIGALDWRLVVEVLKDDFYEGSAVMEYLEHFYGSRSANERLPGITGLIGFLYPEQYPSWANTCQAGTRVIGQCRVVGPGGVIAGKARECERRQNSQDAKGGLWTWFSTPEEGVR